MYTVLISYLYNNVPGILRSRTCMRVFKIASVVANTLQCSQCTLANKEENNQRVRLLKELITCSMIGSSDVDTVWNKLLHLARSWGNLTDTDFSFLHHNIQQIHIYD